MSDGAGEQDQSRSTQLLEIYALEIQMYNATKNYKKLKVGSVLSLYFVSQQYHSSQEIYNSANQAMRNAIPHPRILGVIKECGGKMWMGERMFSLVGQYDRT